MHMDKYLVDALNARLFSCIEFEDFILGVSRPSRDKQVFKLSTTK